MFYYRVIAERNTYNNIMHRNNNNIIYIYVYIYI